MNRVMLYLAIAGIVLSLIAIFVAVLAAIPDWIELIAKLAKVQ